MRDDTANLRHILDAIETIETYIARQTFQQFLNNKMMIDAVCRCYLSLGRIWAGSSRMSMIALAQ